MGSDLEAVPISTFRYVHPTTSRNKGDYEPVYLFLPDEHHLRPHEFSGDFVPAYVKGPYGTYPGSSTSAETPGIEGDVLPSDSLRLRNLISEIFDRQYAHFILDEKLASISKLEASDEDVSTLVDGSCAKSNSSWSGSSSASPREGGTKRHSDSCARACHCTSVCKVEEDLSYYGEGLAEGTSHLMAQGQRERQLADVVAKVFSVIEKTAEPLGVDVMRLDLVQKLLLDRQNIGREGHNKIRPEARALQDVLFSCRLLVLLGFLQQGTNDGSKVEEEVESFLTELLPAYSSQSAEATRLLTL